MPDLGQLAILLAIGVPTAVFLGAPLVRRAAASAQPAADGDHEAIELRRRVAYETIRDLDGDLADGRIDVEQHGRLRAEAEARAAEAIAALEREPRIHGATSPNRPPERRAPRAAAVLGLAVAAAVLAGFALPEPFSLANGTRVDRELAAAIEREQERRERIETLSARLQEDPRDAEALSALADAHLEGSSHDDLVNGALALLALIDLEREREDAYTRLISAYIRASDYDNAAAATDSFAEIRPDSPDVPFFRGLIALRGTEDRNAAIEHFDRFLERAPDDPRAGMVRSLRAEAAGELPSAPAPSVEPDTPEAP